MDAKPGCPLVYSATLIVMSHSELIEVTITHNLRDAAEVDQLYRRQWIALDWDRKGPDPNAYTGRSKTDVILFNTMQQKGAAVIAAYKKATVDRRSSRLLGLVEAGTKFEYLNLNNDQNNSGLLCLPLSKVQNVDSSRNFLGNLAPRQCTVQRCGKRARGRLADLVRGQVSPRSVWSLHHHDVELLVTNYLIVTRMCECVWSGGQSYEDIDHAGWTPDRQELLGQTTVSANLVRKKADRLLNLARAGRVLHFFGPEASKSQCPGGITYHPIETVFSELDQVAGGQWLINRMLSTPAGSSEEAE